MRIRKLLGVIIATVAGLVGLTAAPAATAESFTIVFTAGASVTKPIVLPGMPGDSGSGTYEFDTSKPGLGGQKACVAVTSAGTVDPLCRLHSTGGFGAIAGLVGANCAFSSGKGTVDEVSVKGKNIVPTSNGKGLITVEWPAATGTILPLIFYKGSRTNLVGQGAVQVTGAAPGTCGIGGATTEFQVTGYAAVRQ